MLDSDQFVLHVGLSKTGTTTLQQSVFPKHSEILYLGKDRTLQTPKECVDQQAFEILNPLLWDHKSEVNPTQIGRSMDDFRKVQRKQKGVWLASWEELGNRSPALNLESLRRAQRVFGTCRLLVFLRNPFQRIPSEYLQSLRYNYLTLGKRSLGIRSIFQPIYLSFERWLCNEQKSGNLQILLGTSDLIRGAIDIVGRGSVGVYLFEEFRDDPQKTIRAVCGFLQIDPVQAVESLDHEENHLNARMTEGQVKYLQEMQKSLWKRFSLFRKSSRDRRRLYRLRGEDLEPAKPQLSDQWKGRISDSTREGHRWLSETFGLSMEQYGYPI
jgi:hypothetical protein